jgi:hypothetical protein
LVDELRPVSALLQHAEEFEGAALPLLDGHLGPVIHLLLVILLFVCCVSPHRFGSIRAQRPLPGFDAEFDRSTTSQSTFSFPLLSLVPSSAMSRISSASQ